MAKKAHPSSNNSSPSPKQPSYSGAAAHGPQHSTSTGIPRESHTEDLFGWDSYMRDPQPASSSANHPKESASTHRAPASASRNSITGTRRQRSTKSPGTPGFQQSTPNYYNVFGLNTEDEHGRQKKKKKLARSAERAMGTIILATVQPKATTPKFNHFAKNFRLLCHFNKR